MTKMGHSMQLISRRLGKAIADYQMIEEGDRIIVAVSGGWDSMSLLKLLKARQTFAPVRYELLAVTIDYNNPDFDIPSLEWSACRSHPARRAPPPRGPRRSR